MSCDYIQKEIKRNSAVVFADPAYDDGRLTQGLVVSFAPLGLVVDTGVGGKVLVNPKKCVVIPKKRKPRRKKTKNESV